MNIIVKTTGPHFYVDPQTRCEIPHNRAAVVKPSEFISALVSRGLLTVLSNNLAAEATDAEFQNYLAESEGDTELAVSSFSEAHILPKEEVDEAEKAPTKTTTTKKK